MKNNISVVTWLATNLFAYKEPNPIEIALIKQAQEIEKQQQDEFAIGFAEWLVQNYDGVKSVKELLEIYKNK
jgi:hypothetical protein